MQYGFNWKRFLKNFFINIWKLIPLFLASWIAVMFLLSAFGANANEIVIISSAVVVVVAGLLLFHYMYMKNEKDWCYLLWGLMVGLVGIAALICTPIGYLVRSWNRVSYEYDHKKCIVAGCSSERTGKEYYCSLHLYNHVGSKTNSSYSSAYTGGKTSISTPIYNTSYSYDFDPDDYDSPEDFADDAFGDFNDWDAAYDYWDEY